MSQDAVSYEVEDRVAIITIERPEARNALNESVFSGLEAAWRRKKEGKERCRLLWAACLPLRYGTRNPARAGKLPVAPVNNPSWLEYSRPSHSIARTKCCGATESPKNPPTAGSVRLAGK